MLWQNELKKVCSMDTVTEQRQTAAGCVEGEPGKYYSMRGVCDFFFSEMKWRDDTQYNVGVYFL